MGHPQYQDSASRIILIIYLQYGSNFLKCTPHGTVFFYFLCDAKNVNTLPGEGRIRESVTFSLFCAWLRILEEMTVFSFSVVDPELVSSVPNSIFQVLPDPDLYPSL
jgi:hypothetical protein